MLVDMGSLTNFGDDLQNEFGIRVKTIPLVSTLRIIEAVRKAVMGYPLDYVYKETMNVRSARRTIWTFEWSHWLTWVISHTKLHASIYPKKPPMTPFGLFATRLMRSRAWADRRDCRDCTAVTLDIPTQTRLTVSIECVSPSVCVCVCNACMNGILACWKNSTCLIKPQPSPPFFWPLLIKVMNLSGPAAHRVPILLKLVSSRLPNTKLTNGIKGLLIISATSCGLSSYHQRNCYFYGSFFTEPSPAGKN